MTAHAEPASWWTPSGWITAPVPDAFRRALSSVGRYDFEAVGYGEATKLPAGNPQDDQSLQLEVRNHPEGHVLVQVQVGDFIETLFVAQEHVIAFYFEKVPALMNVVTLQSVAESLTNQVRTLAAFVRHGHGCGTIDEAGEENVEQRRLREESARRWREDHKRQQRPARPDGRQSALPTGMRVQ